METLLERSARFIDEDRHEGTASTNPMDATLHELADDVALVTGFSHVIVRRTDAGLVVFDTSLEAFASPIIESLRAWSDAPVHTIVYTHGHRDHVGGAAIFVADTVERGAPAPRVAAHERVPVRFARYDLTDGYNAVINERQFGPARDLELSPSGRRFAPEWVQPDVLYQDRTQLRVGDEPLELRHAHGETDDHTYVWLPESQAVCTGDLFLWVFPNAGNPQKVQRYPREWAAALRDIAALRAELLLPAHGLPISGAERIHRVLDETARALETLTEQTLALMNEGATLDRIVHEVEVPSDLADRPFLRPVYDEPEFVVRNIWRLYGGWYDGNPARLKPAPDAAIAQEVATLAGSAEHLAARAEAVADDGDLRLACQLVEWAAQAAPDNEAVHSARAQIYAARRQSELSLMSKGIFGSAERESRAVSDA